MVVLQLKQTNNSKKWILVKYPSKTNKQTAYRDVTFTGTINSDGVVCCHSTVSLSVYQILLTLVLINRLVGWLV